MRGIIDELDFGKFFEMGMLKSELVSYMRPTLRCVGTYLYLNSNLATGALVPCNMHLGERGDPDRLRSKLGEKLRQRLSGVRNEHGFDFGIWRGDTLILKTKEANLRVHET